MYDKIFIASSLSYNPINHGSENKECRSAKSTIKQGKSAKSLGLLHLETSYRKMKNICLWAILALFFMNNAGAQLVNVDSIKQVL